LRRPHFLCSLETDLVGGALTWADIQNLRLERPRPISPRFMQYYMHSFFNTTKRLTQMLFFAVCDTSTLSQGRSPEKNVRFLRFEWFLLLQCSSKSLDSLLSSKGILPHVRRSEFLDPFVLEPNGHDICAAVCRCRESRHWLKVRFLYVLIGIHHCRQTNALNKIFVTVYGVLLFQKSFPIWA